VKDEIYEIIQNQPRLNYIELASITKYPKQQVKQVLRILEREGKVYFGMNCEIMPCNKPASRINDLISGSADWFSI